MENSVPEPVCETLFYKANFPYCFVCLQRSYRLDDICFVDCKTICIIPDAWGGHLHCPCEDHAGLQDEGDVQAQHGRAGAVHVPAGHPGPGAHPWPLCPFPITGKNPMSEINLCNYFFLQAIHTNLYASSWFLTLFTTSLPLVLSCR